MRINKGWVYCLGALTLTANAASLEGVYVDNACMVTIKRTATPKVYSLKVKCTCPNPVVVMVRVNGKPALSATCPN